MTGAAVGSALITVTLIRDPPAIMEDIFDAEAWLAFAASEVSAVILDVVIFGRRIVHVAVTFRIRCLGCNFSLKFCRHAPVEPLASSGDPGDPRQDC